MRRPLFRAVLASVSISAVGLPTALVAQSPPARYASVVDGSSSVRPAGRLSSSQATRYWDVVSPPGQGREPTSVAASNRLVAPAREARQAWTSVATYQPAPPPAITAETDDLPAPSGAEDPSWQAWSGDSGQALNVGAGGGVCHGDCGECGSDAAIGGVCLDCGFAACAPCSWFGGAYGLLMTRDRDDDLLLAYDDADPSARRLATRDADMNYAGGFAVNLGRYISDCWAVEGVYWGLWPNDEIEYFYAADAVGNLTSALRFDFLEYDNGTGPAPVGALYDGSQVVRVFNRYRYDNVELNFWRCPLVWTHHGCRCARFGFMAGVRYFRGAEVFDFDADLVNNAFGDDQVNELFYDIEVENHLIGFQLGGRLEYYLSSRFSLQAASKFGIYGNHIRQEQILWGGNGPAQIAAGSPLGNAGLSYVSDSTKNDVAFLGELAVGCAYDLTGHWRLTGGYRAVSLAGVAVPTGQIPQRFDDLVAVDQINSSDDLILHGAYGGLQFAW